MPIEPHEMSAQELAEIDARVAAACPGPWTLPDDFVPHSRTDAVLSIRDGCATTEDYSFIAHARTDIPRMRQYIAHLEAEAARFKSNVTKDFHDIEQLLGSALGYPRFADDQKNFPEAAEADGVCVGDHVASTLAQEAAEKVVNLSEQLSAIRAQSAADKQLADKMIARNGELMEQLQALKFPTTNH